MKYVTYFIKHNHNMRVCRAILKYALRYTKHIEDTARADALAKDFCDYDNDEF